MSIRVRFAPSPTGRLHVGNARVALINWLFARAHGGAFLLRIDDTDRVRSRPELAEAIETDLAWLGLVWDEKVRQSDRLDRYARALDLLAAAGRAYPCYETPAELEVQREAQAAAGRPPRYDRAALALTAADRARLEAAGRRPHWRFRLADQPVGWVDLVRGPQRFPAGSASDPVIVREDGEPLYLFTSVVDDLELGISHVIRGEDHVANTAIQIELIAALGGAPTALAFAHLPLMVDAAGGKLSKRLESLTLASLRDHGIEPLALVSLLARLGTGRPVELADSLEALAAAFRIEDFGRAPPRFDPAELARLNAHLLHRLAYADVRHRLPAAVDERLWLAVRGNLDRLSEAAEWAGIVAGPIAPSAEDPALLRAAASLLPPEPWDEGTWAAWTAALRHATGRSGRALFHPLRLALTGREQGPELRLLLPLIGRERALRRLGGGR